MFESEISKQLLKEQNGKKHFIKHMKTPDGSLKNDCLIRALCEVTGKSYYNICQRLKIPYIASNSHHSIPDSVSGVSIAAYEKAFSDSIEDVIDISSNPYSWSTIKKEAEENQLPTVERFAKAWSRRKQYSKKKLILHTFSPEDNSYHSVYCKNGYYYDIAASDSMLVVRVDIFKD